MSVASTVSGKLDQQGSTDMYELNRRRVYIFPTRFGLSFFVVLLVMLAGSINYNNSLGFLLTFLLGSLSLVAILHTYRNLAGLRVRLRAGRAIFAGQESKFVLQLDNRAGPERRGITVTYSIDAQATSPRRGLATANILADGSQVLDLKTETTERGWMKSGRLVLASRYPLGLFRTWVNYEPDVGVIVFPRPSGVRELPFSVSQATSSTGMHLQGTDDFAGLRNYIPGDSSRRIHWKAMARDQEATVKQFSGSGPTEINLRWTETPHNALEARLSQLALWVVHANAQGMVFSLELPNETFHLAEGQHHRQRCLRD